MLGMVGRKIRKAYRGRQVPHGKQSVRKLMAHGTATNSIELSGDAKSFDRVARKWNVDYAFYKTGPDKYAFSTKIAQCFCAGRCLFSYAPKGTASTQYLLSTESAVVAAAPDELKNGLALIINNKEIRTEYAKRAKRLATQKHDMASVSRQIKDQVGVILRNEANGSRNIREN